MKYQQWKIAQRSQQVCREMERQGVPLLVAATLCARGLTDLDEAKALLSSAEDQLCDPYLMKDMDLATARIGRALRNKESIAVYGDYDVDGITATCLLTHYLRSQGGNVRYYIPDRLTEGYGVNNQAVEELALQGVTLIITVDCGITALAETAYAASLGVDMIVTDHHECKEKLPDAIAVVDPHRKDCPYPFKDLAGVGVALKLVMALGSVSGGEKRANALFHEYADLAAVGTIADVMKLLGENRTIVRVGLKHLKKTRRRGLYALMVEAGTLSRAINSTTVGYCLSPRINAAGRMGRAAMAADLILTDDTERAEYLAHELCELNRQRQGVELDIFNNCLSRLAGGGTYDCLVLADHTWHQGVVGIVASRLAEQFAGMDGILVESEAPEGGPEDALRRRRLDFYRRSGFTFLDYDCVLFGVHYAVCLRSPNGKGTEAGAMAAHQALYAAQFPKWAYEKFIQIPRDPEHPLQPPESWAEQTTLPGLEA